MRELRENREAVKTRVATRVRRFAKRRKIKKNLWDQGNKKHEAQNLTNMQRTSGIRAFLAGGITCRVSAVFW